MSWLQLRLDASPDQVETLEALMLASGAVAVTMEDNADLFLDYQILGLLPKSLLFE